MQDVKLWKLPVAFVLTFVAVYAMALWRGPIGFYESMAYSLPAGDVLSLGSVLLFTLVINAVWWVVIFMPSGLKRPTPA